MQKEEMLLRRLQETEARIVKMKGVELLVNKLILFRQHDDYYRELKRQTSVSLTQNQLISQFERNINRHQFDVDMLCERFSIIAAELILKETAFTQAEKSIQAPTLALKISDMKMELRALNTEIIAKTDFLEELKFRYSEALTKNHK